MGKSLVSCFLTHGVEQGHRVNCSPGRWIPGVTGSQNVTQFHVWWVISLFNDFFAVFDPSPLTPWINYSFYYLRTIGLSPKLLVLTLATHPSLSWYWWHWPIALHKLFNTVPEYLRYVNWSPGPPIVSSKIVVLFIFSPGMLHECASYIWKQCTKSPDAGKKLSPHTISV